MTLQEKLKEYYWRNVALEDRPPESFEKWKKEKQAAFINANVIKVSLKRENGLWHYDNETFKRPENAVKKYFIKEHNLIELPHQYLGYIIHAVIRGLPKEYKWINIDGHKFVEQLYQTYYDQAVYQIDNISIDKIIEDSYVTDEYLTNKPVIDPISYWGLIKNKKLLEEWYNIIGIDFIKRYAFNYIKGGSPGGWPDLSFLCREKKKIMLYEVKTKNDRMKDNQYSCYMEIKREKCYEYSLVFLAEKDY